MRTATHLTIPTDIPQPHALPTEESLRAAPLCVKGDACFAGNIAAAPEQEPLRTDVENTHIADKGVREGNLAAFSAGGELVLEEALTAEHSLQTAEEAAGG